MNRMTKKQYAALLCFALGLVVLIHQFRIYDRLSFAIREWRNAKEWKDRSLWLPDYQVVLEKTVDGIDRNLSGLTWNNDTKTLFAVTNAPTQIFELTTEGEILRRIRLRGFSDTEAVEYIGDSQFIVAEEQKQNITVVRIDPDTTSIEAKGNPRTTLGMGPTGNKGLEGLAWDYANRKLYAAKERNPIHIYEISGFPQAPNTTMDIIVGSNRQRDDQLFVNDLSGLDFDGEYEHLLVLSDASKLVIEVDKSGQPISSLSLIMGNGLSASVPQAEGIALDDKKNLYLVSEPNLFYVFKKKAD